ncbi:MAG: histidine kinase [Saprospiraceae bacterium]
MKITINICFVVWMISINSIFAQQTNYRFINLNERDGLTDKAVYSFTQDHLGFIWTGTASGLYRYDGYKFVKFKSNHDDEYKQISNLLEIVTYDPDYNRLWLKSNSDLQYFDLSNYTFHRLEDRDSLIDKKARDAHSILKVSKDKLWILGQENIVEYHVSTGDTKLIFFPIDKKKQLNFGIFKGIRIGQDEVILASDNRIIHHHLNNSQSSYFEIKIGGPIRDICLDQNGNFIWASMPNQLIKYDIKRKKAEIISLGKKYANVLLHYQLNKIISFDETRLWFSNGLIYDTKSNTISTIEIDDGQFDNQLLYVSSLFMDKEKNLWRGSYESGCSILPFQNHSVQTFPLLNKKQESIETYKTLKLKGLPYLLIVGNSLPGVLKLNIQTGEKTYIDQGLKSSTNVGFDIMERSDGNIVFTDGLHLYTVDIKSNELRYLDTYTSSSANPIQYLMESKEQTLITCSSQYLHFTHKDVKLSSSQLTSNIDKEKNKYENYYFKTGTVCRDSTIYYLSSSGVFSQNGINKPIQRMVFPESNTGKKIVSPHSLLEDKDGNIWITSMVNGLFKYFPKSQKLINLNSSNSAITSDYLTSIALESDHIIVVGSTSQVYRFQISNLNYLNSINKQNGYSRDDTGYDLSIQDGNYFIKNNYGSCDILRLETYPQNSFCNQPIVTSLKIIGIEKLQIPMFGDTTFLLQYDENQITISFASLNFSNSNKNRYKYRLIGIDTTWTYTNIAETSFSRLPAGKYTFEVYGFNGDGIMSEKSTFIHFAISKPFYLQWSFILFSSLFLIGIVFEFYRLKIKKLKDEEKIKRDFVKQLSEIEMKALRAQMNPHFIFNSLNSIQKFIFEKDEYAASQYLTKFSRLIRHILDQSNQDYISIHNELELIKIYVEMESLRFDNQFVFEVIINPNVQMSWMLPSMVIQPHIENAIWHGLLHSTEAGILKLSFEKHQDNQVKIMVEDNGIGREKAQRLKSKQLLKKKSYGSQISESRIHNLNQLYPGVSSFETKDLYGASGHACGTRITMIIPIIENKESNT